MSKPRTRKGRAEAAEAGGAAASRLVCAGLKSLGPADRPEAHLEYNSYIEKIIHLRVVFVYQCGSL